MEVIFNGGNCLTDVLVITHHFLRNELIADGNYYDTKW